MRLVPQRAGGDAVIRYVIAAVVLAPVVLFVVGACCAAARNDETAWRIESDHDHQVAELRYYLDAWDRAAGINPNTAAMKAGNHQ